MNGNVVPYPGITNQNAAVGFASGIRGAYDILKIAWLHTGAHLLSRIATLPIAVLVAGRRTVLGRERLP